MKKTDVFINEKHAGFNPLQFGYHDCDPGYKADYVFRPFWLIHYVVSGSGHLELNGNTYPVEAGSMFIVPPLNIPLIKPTRKILGAIFGSVLRII
ncbi:MAG: AraC family ligand binding domain-containing protein [Clostridia bacterium]|nr:AraC family ligand binding domain-containing protein [Clostridia bacterium]